LTEKRGEAVRRLAAPAAWREQSFLGGLSPAARDALLALGTLRECATPSTLIRAGDRCTDVLILVDGWAKVIGSAADGRQALLALHFSGDLIGEQDALDDRPRSASVISAGPAVVHAVAKSAFLRFMLDWPEAGVTMSRVLCARLRWATSRQLDFSGLPVLARVARVLSDLSELDRDFGYALTQPELAAMIGASEPAVHKAIRQLRVGGVIETGYRRIVVTDQEALDSIAGTVPLVAISSRTAVLPAREASQAGLCQVPATSGPTAFAGARSRAQPHRASARSRRSRANQAGALPAGERLQASARLAAS